jgi:hypothetical protein
MIIILWWLYFLCMQMKFSIIKLLIEINSILWVISWYIIIVDLTDMGIINALNLLDFFVYDFPLGKIIRSLMHTILFLSHIIIVYIIFDRRRRISMTYVLEIVVCLFRFWKTFLNHCKIPSTINLTVIDISI